MQQQLRSPPQLSPLRLRSCTLVATRLENAVDHGTQLRRQAPPPPLVMAAEESHEPPRPSVVMATQGCPPGLGYPALADHVIVSQRLQVVEETGFCTRCLLGDLRPFDMKIIDYRGEEEMQVEALPGKAIGHIKQNWTAIFPSLSVLNALREVALKVKGPLCTSSCMGGVIFDISTPDEKFKIGAISKNWSDPLKEAFTKVDNYTVSFPIDLDVNMKGVLLGCLFLIEFMFFERGAVPDFPTNLA